jgi:hypothetical protein
MERAMEKCVTWRQYMTDSGVLKKFISLMKMQLPLIFTKNLIKRKIKWVALLA